MVREIGWSHNLVILERCKDGLEREFYIRMTKKLGGSNWGGELMIVGSFILEAEKHLSRRLLPRRQCGICISGTPEI